MARTDDTEIVGRLPWQSRLPGRTPGGLTVLITPRVGAVRAVAERYPHRAIAVLATDPSVAEAAVLIHAGADAYLTDVGDLASAVEALRDGRAWMSPIGAAAVCRLARLPGNPAFDTMAAAARAAAAGEPWQRAFRIAGGSPARSMFAALRSAL